MLDIGNAQKRFLDQATKEQSFRKQIINGLIQVLKNPKTTTTMRLLIVSALLTALGLSFLFVTFLVCAVVSLFKNGEHLYPRYFITAMSLLLALFMLQAIFLAFKASTTEQSLRLEDSFDRIYKKRVAS